MRNRLFERLPPALVVIRFLPRRKEIQVAMADSGRFSDGPIDKRTGYSGPSRARSDVEAGKPGCEVFVSLKFVVGDEADGAQKLIRRRSKCNECERNRVSLHLGKFLLGDPSVPG